ncbi:MAG TPA: hypothetical protein VGQ39_14720 [Pyrinomonadaceae bacterium]|jgi:hypothetical protein|nr:hypothetical protein [Pyrinomonadaceae bacterium]
MSSFLVRVIIIVLALLGISAFLLYRRRQHPHAEAGEDVGRGPDSATLAAPDAVELGADIPPRPPVEKWDDQSKRRKLPPGEYRAAADEPETDPEPLS